MSFSGPGNISRLEPLNLNKRYGRRLVLDPGSKRREYLLTEKWSLEIARNILGYYRTVKHAHDEGRNHCPHKIAVRLPIQRPGAMVIATLASKTDRLHVTRTTFRVRMQFVLVQILQHFSAVLAK